MLLQWQGPAQEAAALSLLFVLGFGKVWCASIGSRNPTWPSFKKVRAGKVAADDRLARVRRHAEAHNLNSSQRHRDCFLPSSFCWTGTTLATTPRSQREADKSTVHLGSKRPQLNLPTSFSISSCPELNWLLRYYFPSRFARTRHLNFHSNPSPWPTTAASQFAG